MHAAQQRRVGYFAVEMWQVVFLSWVASLLACLLVCCMGKRWRQVISQQGSYMVLTLRCVLQHTNVPVLNDLVLAVVALLFRDIPGMTLIYDNRCYIFKKDLGFDINVCAKTHQETNDFAIGVVDCLDI